MDTVHGAKTSEDIYNNKKVKLSPNRPWRPIGFKTLRIPHCLDNRLTDGGKLVSPTYRPLIYSPETLFLCFWYSLLLEDE
jgi:hypothetical protein